MLKYKNQNETIITAALTIVTKTRKFVDDGGIDKRKENYDILLESRCEKLITNIYEYIVNDYYYRFGIELCNTYVQFLHDKVNGGIESKNSQ